MPKRKLPKNWVEQTLIKMHERIIAIEVTFSYFLKMEGKEKKLEEYMEKKGNEAKKETQDE